VDNPGGLDQRKGEGYMKQRYAHSFPLVINTLYKANPRAEQGVYNLPTEKASSYYDYLYIHTSSYANNLSTYTSHNKNLKSRG
jgi:hypothetical protein